MGVRSAHNQQTQPCSWAWKRVIEQQGVESSDSWGRSLWIEEARTLVWHSPAGAFYAAEWGQASPVNDAHSRVSNAQARQRLNTLGPWRLTDSFGESTRRTAASLRLSARLAPV
jgi:hypothetical protein